MIGIIEPEKLAALEKAKGFTLESASHVVKALREDTGNIEPFDATERAAVVFLGTARYSGYITHELFLELTGEEP